MTDQAIKYGTAIVLVHLLVNIVHGAAHSKLDIKLGHEATLFVVTVIGICPLLAMVLLWLRKRRPGMLLLALSMAGSLIFGFYKHFVAIGPDDVGAQAPGFWGTAFAVTACLLLATEAIGMFVGLHFLRGDS